MPDMKLGLELSFEERLEADMLVVKVSVIETSRKIRVFNRDLEVMLEALTVFAKKVGARKAEAALVEYIQARTEQIRSETHADDDATS
jgi:ABC-type Fe3+-hydroxamate transport system substrate-binding protein